MRIPALRIGLPRFHYGIGDRRTVAVNNATGYRNALTQHAGLDEIVKNRF
jgi:hypothetical protein